MYNCAPDVKVVNHSCCSESNFDIVILSSDGIKPAMQCLCQVQLAKLVSNLIPDDASACLRVEGSEPDHYLGLLLVIHDIKGPLLDLTRLDHGLRLDPRVEGVNPTQKGLLSLLTGL